MTLDVRVRRGVSLIELIVVFAIIGALLCLLMPAVNRAYDASRRTQCQSNLHQLGLAMDQFIGTKRRIPAAPTSGTMSGWAIEILPFMEETNLAAGLAGSPPLTSTTALQSARFRPAIMRCPAGNDGPSDLTGVPVSHYAAGFQVDAKGRRSWREIGDLLTDSTIAWVESPEYELMSSDQAPTVWPWTVPHSGGFNVTLRGGATFLAENPWWVVPESQ